jgi:hypothetical protein
MLLALTTGANAQPTAGARYLIIAADEYVDALRPLADWKTRKGMLARIVPLSEAGSNPEAVQTFIRDAHRNWPVPPAYILIACSPLQLPGAGYEDDCFYGNMTGDWLMELPVGRFPAENISECSTMVRRTIAYETHPDSTDSLWLLRSTTIVCEESPPDQHYQADSRLARQYWVDYGYVQAESLMNFWGHNAWTVAASMNQGRSFITYRGLAGAFWTWPFFYFQPDSVPWNNGAKTPVFVSATCATVTVAPFEDMLGNLAIRHGTPDGFNGAVAWFGTTRLGMRCSQYRSACYRGFFDAVYGDSINVLGPATIRGRNRVDSLLHEEYWYTEWCLLGDPELNLWTANPRTLSVEHDTVLPMAPDTFDITVRRAGSPVPGATVCLSLDSAAYMVGTTDANGRARLAVAPTHPGTMQITVTGRNLRPYLGDCRVAYPQGPWVGYLRHVIHDSLPMGNRDGWAGAGETVRMPTWLENIGDSTATGITARMTTADSFVTMLDSLLSYGTIAGGDSAGSGTAGFRFRVDSACPDGHIIRARLACSDTAGHQWHADVYLRTGAPLLAFADTIFDDRIGNNNGRLDPRESSYLVVEFDNFGWGEAVDARATLRSSHPWLTVDDSISLLGTIPGKCRVTTAGDPFRVTAGHMLPGIEIPCTLDLAAIGKHWSWPFVITVGVVDTCDPIPDGPREPPLYWAYDDVDIGYPEAPAYDWLEIRDIGTRLELGNDETRTVHLSTEFGSLRYYGIDYDAVSISSNGWFAPGSTGAALSRNYRLPWSTPVPIIAVNWQDLRPDLGGGVYWYHDTTNHRFIIEWDSVAYKPPFDSLNDCFQALIYDTTATAPDGNNQFVLQFRTAGFMYFGTTGIQDENGQVGISVKHRTIYDHAAAGILPGRAIRFTTSGPPIAIRAASIRPLPAHARIFADPNPARNRLALHLRLARAGPTRVTVYDATGRRIRRLHDAPLPAGEHVIHWNRTDDYGRRVPAGTCFIRLETPDGTATCRAILVR